MSEIKRKSYLFPYIRHKLTDCRTLFVVSIVFNALLYLVSGVGLNVTIPEYCKVFDPEALSPVFENSGIISFMILFFIVGMISAAVLVICAIISSTVISSHNTNKDKGDMYLSLPMTIGQRFTGDIITGGIINILPMVLCWGILNIFSLIYDSRVGEIINSINSHKAYLQSLPYAPLLIFAMLITVVISSFITGVFINSAAGKFSVSILYTFVFIGAMFVFVSVISSLVCTGIPGVDLNSVILPVILACIPPFGILFGILENTYSVVEQLAATQQGYYITFDKLLAGFTDITFFIQIGIVILLLVLAFFITKKRKAENTGRGFSNYTIHYMVDAIVVSCIIMAGYLVAFTSEAAAEIMLMCVLIALFIAAVTHFFMELVAHRSFKRWYFWIVRFISVVIVAGIISVVLDKNTFGLKYYSLDYAEKMNNLSVSVDIYDENRNIFGVYIEDNNITHEERKATVDYNRFLIDSSDRNIYSYQNSGFANLMYSVSDGNQLSQSFKIPSSNFYPEQYKEFYTRTMEYCMNIMNSDEFYGNQLVLIDKNEELLAVTSDRDIINSFVEKLEKSYASDISGDFEGYVYIVDGENNSCQIKLPLYSSHSELLGSLKS